MINKILIANRGEIAARIIRTCRELFIPTVAIYSEADSDAPFVKMADEAVAIGGLSPTESYLDIAKVITAAQRCGADAVHPGYGFLAENAAFARSCAEAGLTFIGPSPEAIEAMGSKIRAKEIMMAHGVPVVPGYQGAEQSDDVLIAEALRIGFPVLVKASAGGGGKGMRVVRKESELSAALATARREAQGAFGDDTLLLEKYFDSVRHIEVQVFGDSQGNMVHLFERECSVQRRHQKIIEESPSPFVDTELRTQLGSAAVVAAQAIGYSNAGTVEFIVDPERNFYFLEVNTRLQVEHPVTEMVTGQDLVAWQIRVAEGHPLPCTQEALQLSGHAIECRLYAEDPSKDFQPATGRLLLWDSSDIDTYCRTDSGVDSGQEISSFYDPMLAKLITHGPDRQTALRKMRRALRDLKVLGLETNQAFLGKVLAEQDFERGNFDTHYLERHPGVFEIEEASIPVFLIAALLSVWSERNQRRGLLSQLPSGWRNNYYQPQSERFAGKDGEQWTLGYRSKGEGQFEVHSATQTYDVVLEGLNGQNLTFSVDGLRKRASVYSDGEQIFLHIYGESQKLRCLPRLELPERSGPSGSYRAPLPGQVVKVLVAAGSIAAAGEGLVVINSMKMENTIYAAEEGIVEEVFVSEGAFVEADTLLLRLNPFSAEEKS